MSLGRRILILCDDDPGHAGNVLDHLGAFRTHSRHEVSFANPRVGDRGASLNLNSFDAVVIHYTLVVTYDSYLPQKLADRISRYSGLKIQFIQDEYRWVEEITAKMRELGIDIIFSVAPESAARTIYGDRVPGAEIITTLAGFVPDELVGIDTPDPTKRPIDVGYRGRHVAYWLGRLGQDKIEIGRRFERHPATQSLRRDIAWTESDRLYGERWVQFLSSCRTTLGTESGASIVDITGSIERETTAYLVDHPAATFEDAEAAVLAPHEGNVVINVISPRVFEAAALRTGLVLFPGSYSGAIEAWTHYIPLAKDFSNIEEVVASIRDDDLVASITRNARADLVQSGKYSLKQFVDTFDAIVTDRVGARPVPGFEPDAAVTAAPGPANSTNGRPVPRGKSTAVKTWVKRLYADYAMARSPETRRLMRAYTREPAARAIVPEERFREDIQKLALLAGIQQRRLMSARPFVIDPLIAEDRLVLAARPLTDEHVAAARANAGNALRRLAAGEVNEIVWHHAAIGLTVPILMPGRRTIPIAVGYYGMNGVHHFSGLERLRTVLREPLHDALEAAMMPPGPLRRRDRARIARALAPSRHVLPLLAREPGNYAVRGAFALRFALREPRLGKLLRECASEPHFRQKVHPVDLLDDILKLALLRRFIVDSRRDTVSGGFALVRDEDSKCLVIRSSRGADAGGRTISDTLALPIRRLIWDHSEFGPTVLLSAGVSTTLEEDGGAHEFRALAEICDLTRTDISEIVRSVVHEGAPT